MKEVTVSTDINGTIVKEKDPNKIVTVKATIPINWPIDALSPKARAAKRDALEKERAGLLGSVSPQFHTMTSADFVRSLPPEQQTKARDLVRINAEISALSQQPEYMLPPQRGPSLDELNLGLGNVRSLIYSIQQPPAPIVRP
jgi:hypothetical protein